MAGRRYVGKSGLWSAGISSVYREKPVVRN